MDSSCSCVPWYFLHGLLSFTWSNGDKKRLAWHILCGAHSIQLITHTHLERLAGCTRQAVAMQHAHESVRSKPAHRTEAS